MLITNILMAIGIVFILLSFFIKDRSKKIESDLEELSINIYQETNNLKRRLKIIEEEILLDGPPAFKAAPKQKQSYAQAPVTPASTPKPVNGILVSQVLALSKQGLSVEEIEKRSALTVDQIIHILRTGGQ